MPIYEPWCEECGTSLVSLQAGVTALTCPLKTSLVCGKLFWSLSFTTRAGFHVAFIRLIRDFVAFYFGCDDLVFCQIRKSPEKSWSYLMHFPMVTTNTATDTEGCVGII